MLQIDLIEEFLDKKTIAVVGVSRKGKNPANLILKKFKSAGYETYGINPKATEIDGEKCYPDIGSLPIKPEAVMLAGPPGVSESAVLDCIEGKVSIVWMHRGMGEGSYSEKAEEECKANGIKVITNGCPMMFVGKVDPFHRVFRWFKKM
jgi:hypothetical protein